MTQPYHQIPLYQLVFQERYYDAVGGYIGRPNEVTIDPLKRSMYIHDGVTCGGIPLKVHITDVLSASKVSVSNDYNDLDNIPDPFELPIASAGALGGVRIGDRISIDVDGIISANPTNLTIDRTANNVTILSSTGNDVLIGSANSAQAGVMTAAMFNKLDGIADGANNYTHPTTHAASMITGLATVATSGEYSDLLNKPDLTVYELLANKGIANGYANLDSNAKIPLALLPDTSKQKTSVLLSTDSRPASPLEGDKLFETDTGDSYIYDGSSWVIMSDANWENVNIEWANINGKPTTISGYGITDALTEVNLSASALNYVVQVSNSAGDGFTIPTVTSYAAGVVSRYQHNDWNDAHSHISTTNNPHNVTAAQLGALTAVPGADISTIGGFKVVTNIAGYYLDTSDRLWVDSSKYYSGTPTTTSVIAFHNGTSMYKATISDILALGGSGMVYPSAGIPISTGSGWSGSITNNSSNWNTAYSWGNHADQNYLTTIPTASTTVTGGFKTISNIGGYYISSGVLRVDSSKYNTGTPTTSSVIAFHNGSTMYKASISEILALSASNQWSTDTEGIYTNSNVGIGGNSIAGYRLKIYGSITTTDSITVSENITVVKKVSAAGYTCSQYYSTSSAPNSTLFAVGSNLYYKDASGTVHTIV